MGYKCPICRKDPSKGVCAHFVANLRDDGDGYDTEVPVYFGLEGVTADHKQMTDSAYHYFVEVKNLVLFYASANKKVRSMIDAQCAELSRDEFMTARDAIGLFRVFEERPSYDIEDVIWNMDDNFKNSFEIFYLTANGGCNGDNKPHEISHSPGITWTGKNYWSDDGRGCAKKIAEVLTDARLRLAAIIASHKNPTEIPE